ncbi:MAG TPA: hypothetical protein VGV93_10465 [Acidimicrobiales bacterium]|nr:hypothetical protein [Acidimicrobiales bacterium]
MVAVSMAQGLRCGSCHRLYVYLDARQGTRSWAVKGAGEVADRLSWQLQTAQKHLRHLADVGIVALDPEPVRAWGNTVVRLRHAPARARFADLRPLAGVWEPEPERRWRQPARSREELDRLRSPDAWRDAPAAPVEDVRTHSATRQPEREPEKVRRASPAGAPHQPEPLDAWRDAPSVPGSKRSKDCLSGAPRSTSAAVAVLDALGPVVVVCAECDAPADGVPSPDGTPMCTTHEPF